MLADTLFALAWGTVMAVCIILSTLLAFAMALGIVAVALALLA